MFRLEEMLNVFRNTKWKLQLLGFDGSPQSQVSCPSNKHALPVRFWWNMFLLGVKQIHLCEQSFPRKPVLRDETFDVASWSGVKM